MGKKRCDKLTYASRSEAEAAVRTMLRKYPSAVYKKIYRCAKCRAWHVTSTPPSASRPGRVKH